MRGPSLFIAQYIGPPPLFERLADIAAFAHGLGFRALQIPVHDGRILDLARAEDSDYLQAIETLLADHGLVISELRPQRGMSVHLSFDVARAHLFDAATGRRVPAASA